MELHLRLIWSALRFDQTQMIDAFRLVGLKLCQAVRRSRNGLIRSADGWALAGKRSPRLKVGGSSELPLRVQSDSRHRGKPTTRYGQSSDP